MTTKTTNRSGWPHFDDDEIEMAVEVLRSGRVNYWTGHHGRAFEREYAASVGVKHAIALSNGTLALEAALHGLEIGVGDDVVVPARTFIATASAVVARGGNPVVADVDRDSGNLTAQTVEAALTPDTRAVIAVHIGGWPCELDELRVLCDSRSLDLIEDCAQAHGAKYRGRQVGCVGRAATLSFCQDKVITTAGEGGMLLTDDDQVARRVITYKDHGKHPELVEADSVSPAFKWVHGSFGSNWRMTEVQCAIGRAQLQKLPRWLEIRAKNASRLMERLSTLPGLRVPEPPRHVTSAWYKLYAYVDPTAMSTAWDRDRVLAEVQRRGARVYGGSCPEIYLERAFVDRGWGPAERLPVAKALGETSLMFLVDPTVDQEELERVATVVSEVMAEAVDPA